MFVSLALLQRVVLWLSIPKIMDVVVEELVAEMRLVLLYRVARFQSLGK